MKIKFNKLKVGNRFDNSFEKWINNNEVEFTKNNFVDIYASNGVGKSSFANALCNEIQSEYEYEYNGKIYNEKSLDAPIIVISDFFLRNIATRENEKLSDYILGTQIKRELELKKILIEKQQSIKDKIIDYLKNEYKIKSKDTNFYHLANNDSLKVLINALANSRDKGKEYDERKLLGLKENLRLNPKKEYNTVKYEYIKENLEVKDSIIKQIIDLKLDNIKAINNFSKLEISNDAIDILNKHENLKKCIFDESHELAENIKEILENNKKIILNALEKDQKKVIDNIYNLGMEPFEIKKIFNIAFETGNIDKITELVKEIVDILSQIENSIINFIVTTIDESKLEETFDEYNNLVNNKVELSEEDELLLKNIIENCINKRVNISRDINKNIIFTIDTMEIIKKSRSELPLSTGEQNFISLYFELLSAKNSNKDIVIIDDPISSFDSIYKNKIIYSIIKVLENKKVIILTHNINTIKLMQHQYKNCFNFYVLNNEKEGNNNGFALINVDEIKLILEIKNVINLFKNINFIIDIKEKKQFLVAVIPFMRSYVNLIDSDQTERKYKNLCKLMHGYESDKVDLNEAYNEIFGINIRNNKYEINAEDIIKINIVDEIVNKEKYPLLNRTLIHILNYLKLRLIVEYTLYKTDTTKLQIDKHPQLHEVISIYLSNKIDIKSKLMSKKTLLNEFNHFEYDMCLFMPSLDISDTKLVEERNSILEICESISKNAI